MSICCGKPVEVKVVPYPFQSRMLGEVIVPEVQLTWCSVCDTQLLSPDEAGRITDYLCRVEEAHLREQPIGDFISAEEAARMLKTTPQGIGKLHRSRMIYRLDIGKRGRPCVLFHRESVKAYIRRRRRRDGRIFLGGSRCGG